MPRFFLIMLHNMLQRCKFLLLALSVTTANAQTTTISGIVNRYAAVLGYDHCSGTINVSDTAGFQPGARILVMHMQGATAALSNNPSFGNITELLTTGRYEVAEIAGRNSTQLILKNLLTYPIPSTAVVQLVTYPDFQDVAVQDTIRPLPWDGQKGGVVAFRVHGTLTLDAPVIADGMGFRGGVSYLAPNNNCTWLIGENAYTYALGNWRGGAKGEGIVVGQAGSELGRGALGNGGGGGNDHNSGGGGGSNTGAGGQGGENDEPSTFGCDGLFPGLGAKSLSGNPGRIFMGGGGGAGHTNNGLTSDGGNGGGIIIIDAGNINGANPKISANGLSGVTSLGDGGGGGGAGGTIWLKINALPVNAIVRAIGGNGGNASGNNSNRCFGPGGGGGGGAILTSAANGNLIVQGGTPGVVINSTSSCNSSTNNAANGQNGQVIPLEPIAESEIPVIPPTVLSQPTSQTVCNGDTAIFTWQLVPENSTVQWLTFSNLSLSWVIIPGATNTSLVLPNVPESLDNTLYYCELLAGGCYTMVSSFVELEIEKVPVADFLPAVITLDAYVFYNLSQDFTGFRWDFGDGTSSNEPEPVHAYQEEGIYGPSLTVWNNCGDTVTVIQEIFIELPPVAAFEVGDTVLACGPVAVQFTNLSTNATNYEWSFPGGTPSFSADENPLVNYTVSGSYTATLTAHNAVTSASTNITFYVESLPFPLAAFETNDLPGGPGVQFSFTGNAALSYSWNFGDGSSVSTEINPAYIFPGAGDYTVRLTVTNFCGVSILEKIITVVDESSGLNELAGARNFLQIWPNSAQNQLFIKSASQSGLLTVLDVTGKKIMQEQLLEGQVTTVNLSDLPAGIYGLRFGDQVYRFCHTTN